MNLNQRLARIEERNLKLQTSTIDIDLSELTRDEAETFLSLFAKCQVSARKPAPPIDYDQLRKDLIAEARGEELS